jgi:cytochrome P450
MPRIGEDLSGVDLMSPSSLHDPYTVLGAIREAEPIMWSERHNAWLFTRYDDVAAGFFNSSLSSNRIRPLLDSETLNVSPLQRPVLEMLADWMVVADPPAHSRLRRLVVPAFRPDRIAELAGPISAMVRSVLKDFAVGGEQDFVGQVAYPLPASVIASILGAPVSDHSMFREWSDDLALVAFGTGGDEREDRHTRAFNGLGEMLGYFKGLVERTRSAPGDNLLSDLLHTDVNNERLSDEEVEGLCALLLFAGHETTTNLLASTIALLLLHPDQLALLRDDPTLSRGAIEESLRYEGPIKIVHRWVVADFEVAGVTIREGQRVFLCIAAANRDPRRFPEPDVFDITRQRNQHLAFGKGIHSCIGAQLSRTEGRIVLEESLDLLSNLEIVDTNLRWHESLAARGLTELVLRRRAAT